MKADASSISVLSRVAGEIRHRLRRQGLLAKLRRLLLIVFKPSYRRWLREECAFDEAHGVDTAGNVYLSELGVPAEQQNHAVRYQAIPRDLFNSVISALPITYEDHVFIDVGSGKGRPLLLASHFPFKKIIGVELSPRLNEIARSNIRAYRSPGQRCRNIEALCLDATAFEFPEGPFILHLNNPFDGHIMGLVLANLEASLRNSPRAGHVVYFTPRERALLDGFPRFQILTESEYHVLYVTRQESVIR